jgi:hypothetical protein
MKPCKTCKGKGWLFSKGQVIAGWDRFMGIEMPRMKNGMVKLTCSKCFGKGQK